ncbi:pimelyl-ACP methyl ester esterase BioV [Sulfuricurvum sp.]|uniref:pimelyl-ACP methyl ester esterase BioV n=1 Tax=Sulfuricurvum sp. TaxID=2025608 RepID=UPI003BB50151
MRFYSGFALSGDQHFFDPYLKQSEYTVAGFSYGAIKAAQYVHDAHERIDTLQLFSPAFFQTKKESFRRLQMGGYFKNSERYLENFVTSCFAPLPKSLICIGENNAEGLEELLYFEWTSELMESICSKGTRIEVYLGLEDQVIDVAGAREFFLPYATIISIRRGNHFLQESL